MSILLEDPPVLARASTWPEHPPGNDATASPRVPYAPSNIEKKSTAPITLGGGFKHFLFSPLPGEMIQFD